MTDAGNATEELALMLMYLCRQREKEGWAAWKGYEWVTVDELEHAGLVTDHGKTVRFTDEGMEKARELLEKYGIEDWPELP